MIKLVEVGPRDGLQNEARPVSAEVKVAFLRALSQAGYAEISTSFVCHHAGFLNWPTPRRSRASSARSRG